MRALSPVTNTHLCHLVGEGFVTARGLAHTRPPICCQFMVVGCRLALWECLEGTSDLYCALQCERQGIKRLSELSVQYALHESSSISKNDKDETLLTSQSMNPTLHLDLLVPVFDSLAQFDLRIALEARSAF